MKIHDVIVIGAGPAGSAMAILLAREGYSVLLLEKGVFPRDKVCGDFVSPKGLYYLQKLGCYEEIAQRVGRSRTAVTNSLRLLRLPSFIQEKVLNEEMSMGHARALIPLSRKDQLHLAEQIVARGLSVREAERRAKLCLDPPKPRTPAAKDPNIRAAEEKLEERWKTRVEIRRRGRQGQIILHFHSPDDLERLYQDLWCCQPE